MRILYIDIDSCRPDHLGCYGYHRNTSPCIDSLAKEAAVFDNCYVSDSPCLPSRTALFWGQFGYRTGVVNHGGRASQLFSADRGFNLKGENTTLAQVMGTSGYHTVSISSFMDRHSAWHVCQGWREIFDNGKHGHELAEDVNRLAIPWLKQHAKKDQWFMHLNYWDPHRQYRTPLEFGHPFKNDPPPAWPDQKTIEKQHRGYSPYAAAYPLIGGGQGYTQGVPVAREVPAINNTADFKTWIDGYDTAIRYVDHHIGEVIQQLKEAGVLEDTLIVISADHGENEGEFNTYGDHMTADQSVNHVPLIVRWPGVTRGTRHQELLYQLDLSSTLCDITGVRRPKAWDSQPFTAALRGEPWQGRPYLVLGHGAHTVQRSVRVDDWLMIRTFHAGLKQLPELMLFDVKKDPHQTNDLSTQRLDVVQKCGHLMNEWQNQFCSGKKACYDPYVTILQDGGPHHATTRYKDFCDHLRKIGNHQAADEVASRF